MSYFIFDLDGTILDSMAMWNNLTKDYLENFGFIYTEDFGQKLTTMGLIDGAAFMNDYYNLGKDPSTIVSEMEDRIYDFYGNDVLPKDGALEILENFYSRGIPMCLGTATDERFVNVVLKRFNLKGYFNRIFTVQNTGFSKSNRVFFDLILSEISVPASDVFLFDDAIHALRAARSTGINTVAVYDINSVNFWEEAKAENKFHTFDFKEWR